MARSGLVEVINQLAPNVQWRDGGLDVRLRTHTFTEVIDADSVIFVPSAFAKTAVFCAGAPAGASDLRAPLILYPAIPPEAARPRRMDELIGATRAQVLAELVQPRTTGELAQRLRLSPGTVSYHLQILHHAGLIKRTRSSRHVLYQCLPE